VFDLFYGVRRAKGVTLRRTFVLSVSGSAHRETSPRSALLFASCQMLQGFRTVRRR
jgi:hypothetical protein